MTDDSTDDLSGPENYDRPDEWPEWWLPPPGHGISRVSMVYSGDGGGGKTDIETEDMPFSDTLGSKVHVQREQHPIREFAAVLDAYSGYVPVPEDHPSDEHPLGALYALRALRQCVANLSGHPFVEPDETTVGALEAVERDLRAAEAKFERECENVGLPTERTEE